ncbi:MAG: hypothetical protein JWM11_511 [Planctomycetaceae bacterium]|nr:hypothetical protein [Planctomycetaceae bacterium]
MLLISWLSSFQDFISGKSGNPSVRGKKRRCRPAAQLQVYPQLELLEDRSLLSGFSESVSALNINLVANEHVAINANGSSYTLSLDSGQIWTGSDSANVSGNGTGTITVTSAGISIFHTVNVTDSGSGTSVTFVNSGSNSYFADFSVVLDDIAAGTITFTGSSTFDHALLSATTTRSILVDTGSIVTTVDGGLTLSANQQVVPTSGDFVGVNVNGGQLIATGTSQITLVGKGGTGGGSQIGVEITNGAISSNNQVSITGLGGAGVGDGNDGVNLTANSQVVTTGASIIVTGTAGSGTSVGIEMSGAGSSVTNSALAGASIALYADRIDLQSGTVSTTATGTVSVSPLTAGTTIDLGSALDNTINTLELSDIELDLISAGNLNIGNASAGNITVSAGITRPALTNVQLTSNGAVNFAAGSIDTSGGQLSIMPGSAGVGIANSGVDASVGPLPATGLVFAAGTNLNVSINGNIADSTYQQLQVAGSTTLTGLNLQLSGSYTPVTSDSFEIVDNDGADPIVGTFNGLPEGAFVSVNGVTKKITYVGGDGNDVVLMNLTLTAALSAGTLTITDRDPVEKNNNLTVSSSGANLMITDAVEQFTAAPAGGTLSNGNRTLTIPLSSVTAGLILNTRGGDDTVTLDLTGGNAIPGGGISFNGGAQATAIGDRLQIVGGSQGTVTYNYTNANDGSIVMSSFGTVNYTGLEPISNDGAATDVVFNLTAADDAAEFVDDGIGGNDIARLVSNNNSFEQTDFSLPTGSLTINTGTGHDSMTITNVDGLAASLTVNGTAGSADVSGSANLSLGAGKNLSIVTAGNVNLSGVLTVPGTTSVTAGTGGISLANPANTLTGAVSLSNSGSSDVTVAAANTISLASVSVGTGTLNVTGVGISQSGPVVQATGATGAAFNGGAGVITLTNPSNDFTGPVSLSNSGTNAVSLIDTNAVILGVSNLGSSTLTVSATGITQTGSVVQAAGAGTATFNAGAAALTLTNSGNDFTGLVNLNNSGANDVAVTDSNAITLGTLTIGTGALTVTGVGIFEAAAIVQPASAGNATFNGGTGIINLSTNGNDFTGAVSLNNSGANPASVTDLNAILLGPSLLGQNLTVTSGGTVTQSGVISAGNLSVASVGGINLTTFTNTVTGFSASNTTSGNIQLLNDETLVLTSGNVINSASGGTIVVTNFGNLSSTGTVNTNNGAITVDATGVSNLTIGGAVSSGTNANIILSADQTVTLSANVTTLGTGTLTVGGDSITNAENILVNNGAVISTVDGRIRFRANASVGTSGTIAGIAVNSATVSTSGIGILDWQGTGGTDGGIGIDLTSGALVQSTASGTIQLVGTGGNGVGAGNYGIAIDGGSVVKSTGTASVTLTGTGGGSIAGSTDNDGVNLGASGSASIQTTGSGTIQIVGIAGFGGPASGSFGIQLEDTTGVAITTNNKALQLNADSMAIGTTHPVITAGTNTVTLITHQDGTNIDLGGGDSAGTLGLTDAELDRITATNLVIDARSSGVVNTSANITRSAATNITIGGRQINLVSGSVNSAGGSIVFSPAETVRASNSGTDIIGNLSFSNRAVGRFSSSGNGSVLDVGIGGATVDSGYQQYKISGTIDLTGTDLQLDGAYIPLAGDVFTIVSATNITGTFNGLPEGATRGFNNRDLQIHYTATGVTLTDVNTANSPDVSADNASVQANESNPSLLHNSGIFSDPQGVSTVTITANFGSVTQNNSTGIWNWSIDSSDGLSLATVIITATDTNGHTTTTSFNYTVFNVAPTIALSGNATVNEGSVYTLNLGAITDPGIDTVTNYSIVWGDGVTSNFAGNPVGVNRNHTYADGPHAYTISVTLTDEDGTFSGAGTKSVTVNNVAPTITLSGNATTNEGAVYSLSLNSITDPGTDTVSAYSVNWGDGTVDNFSGDPTGLVQTHTYLDGLNNYTIVVSLTDEDGTYPSVGSLAVTVNNVSPTISLTGNSTTNEGSVYSLTLGTVVDPGADTVSAYKVNWGDGTIQTFAGNPSGLTYTHTYADGPQNQTIVVTLTDEDGTVTGGTLGLTVNNVAPTVVLSGNASVQVGNSYSLGFSGVTDPGTDTVTGYSINWGDGTIENLAGSPANLTRTHTYTLTNPYAITVTLTDEDGTFSNPTTQSVIVTGTLSASLSTGVLTVADIDATGRNNNLTVSRTGANYVIADVNEQFTSAPAGGTLSTDHKTLTIPSGLVSSLIINSLAGNDLLTVDRSTGDPIPTGGLTFNGGNPTTGTGDQLLIVGGTATDTTFGFVNTQDGSVSLDGAVVNYTGVESVASTVTSTNVTLNYSTSAETITVIDSGTAGQTKVTSTAGESTTFANPTGTLTINAGVTGDDVVTVNGFGSGFAGALTIDGQSGNDTVNWATTQTVGSLSISAETISLQNDVTTTGDQVYNGPVKLAASRIVTGQNLTFAGTVDSQSASVALSLNPASGKTTDFQAAVGSLNPLTTLTMTGGGDTTFESTLRTTGNVTQSGGTGTTTLSGTSGAGIGGTLSLTTKAITFNSATTNVAGAVTLTADAMIVAAALNAGSNTVTLVQATNGTTIDVGGADAVGILGLTDTELDLVTGGTIQIGNSNSGTITVSAAITHSNNLSLTTGAGVNFAQSVTMASNKSLTVSAVSTINLSTSSSDLATSGTGAMLLTSTGRNISMSSGSSLTTVNGNVTLQSANNAATGNFVGVTLDGAAISSTGSGTISVTGFGGDDVTTANHYGIALKNAATVQSTGTGTLTLTGTAGDGSSGSSGVSVQSGSQITSVGGQIQVTGNASTLSSTTSSLDRGVEILGSGSLVQGTLGANVSITGTGGLGNAANKQGIYIAGAAGVAAVSTANGTLTLTGIGTAGTASNGNPSQGIWIDAGSVNTTGTGSATLIADLVDMTPATGGVNVGANTATIRQLTNARPINLGTEVVGQLSLTDAELDTVTAGTLQIGDTNSGAVSVSAAITRPSATIVRVTTGSNVVFGPAGSLNSNGAAVVLAAASGNIQGDAAILTNVIASSLTATAASGIGAANAIETAVSTISYATTTGAVAFTNGRAESPSVVPMVAIPQPQSLKQLEAWQSARVGLRVQVEQLH